MASTSVKVALRVRPLSAKEVLASAQQCVSFYGPGVPQVSIAPGNSVSVAESLGLTTASSSSAQAKSFTFDHVFDTESRQEQVYGECVQPLVERFLEGFNATVLAYGQTGSGKTYSMGTGMETAGENFDQGIVPRAIYFLFDKLAAEQARLGDGFQYEVLVSFLELYNEELVDLLNPRSKDGNSGLSIREDSSGRIVWYGVREVPVNSPEGLLEALAKGSLCRSTGSTDMNASSSRSHAIFSVILRQQRKVDQIPETDSAADAIPETGELSGGVVATSMENVSSEIQSLVSKFHFVDLAGSERLKRTNAEGDRKKEGISINQGLLALGNVISALGDDTRRSANQHVPYRDSKLTRMLQDSLGGNSQTLMLACVSPSSSNYAETLNTLNYANRARNIKNKVVINQEWGANGANFVAMEREIRILRATVAQLRAGGATWNEMARSDTFGDLAAAGYQQNQQISMPGGIRDREAQMRIQKNRETEEELEGMRRERDAMRFENDRLKFRCFRLQDRCRELGKELADAIVRRDEVVVAYTQSLAPSKKRKGDHDDDTGVAKLRRVLEDRAPANTAQEVCDPPKENADKVESTSSGSSPIPGSRHTTQAAYRSLVAAHPIIQSYVRTISDYRFRLSEAEDNINWYNDVLAKLSGKTRSGKNAFAAPSRNAEGGLWSAEEIGPEADEIAVEFDIPLKPVFKGVLEVANEVDAHDVVEAAGEKRLMEALNANPLPTDLTGIEETQDDQGDSANVKVYGVPRAVSLVREPSMLFSVTDEGEDDGSASAVDKVKEDALQCIAKIQADIQDHEKIMSRMQMREQEYESLKASYDQKLRDFTAELHQAKSERDLALQKMQDGGKRDEKKGTLAIKQRYEDKRRELERQIDSYKRRLAETSKSRDERRGKEEGLMRNLKDTVLSLKSEKARMVKQLRRERELARSLEMQSKREIANLIRKQKRAADMLKTMEHKNQIQLQRIMSQRRTDDTRQKKSVMKILRRTTTPQRISKPGTSNGSASPKRVKGNHGTWKVTSAPVTRPGSSASVLRQRPSTGLSRTSGRNSPEGKTLSELDLEGSLSVRAALRKELLDKELESCLAVRRAKALLAALQVPMAKLTGEQKELLDEREKVVKAEEARTGRYEPEAWQYMDGRLGELDQEIATVNAKIVEAEESLRLARLGAEGGSQQQDDMASPAGPGNSDLGWENALNLVRTFDPFELEAVVELYLDEIVKLRFAVEESETRESDLKQRLSDKERITAELKLASKEAERKFKKAIADAIEQSNDTKLEEREAEKENAVVRDGAVPSPTRPESKTKQAWHDDDKGEPAQPKAGIDVVAESMKPVPINLTNPPVTVHRAQVSNDMPQVAPARERADSDIKAPDTLHLTEQKAAITNIIQEAQAAPVTKSMSFMDRLALIGGGELAKRLAKNVDSKGSTRSGSPTVTSINAAASSPPVDEGNVPEEVSSRDGDSRGRDQPASPDRTLKPKASGGKSPQRSGSGSSSTSASPREILPPGVQRRAHHMRAPETISEPRERSPRWASAGDRQRVPSTSPPKRVQTPPMISPTRKTNPAPEPRRGFEANAARPPQQDELQALSPAYPTTSMNPTSSAPFQALRTAFNSAYNTTHTAPSQPPSSAPTPSTAWAFNTSVSNPNNANANLRGPTGADVFERLAHAHTLASQAKVIHRGGEAGTSTVTAPNTQTSPSNTTNQQP